MAVLHQGGENTFYKLAIFLGMGTVKVIHFDMEIRIVPLVAPGNPGYEFFRCDAFFFRGQHDRRAMGVAGTDKHAVIAAQLLKTHPDICLHVFQHMAEVQGAVCIRQGAAHQDLAFLSTHYGSAPGVFVKPLCIKGGLCHKGQPFRGASSSLISSNFFLSSAFI